MRYSHDTAECWCDATFTAAVCVLSVCRYVSPVPLSASVAFTSMTLFAVLRLPLLVYPALISTIAGGRVSTKRLSDFFSLPDMRDYREFVQDDDAARGAAAEFIGATLEWPHMETPAGPTGAPGSAGGAGGGKQTSPSLGFTLCDTTLAFPRGKLTSIVGSVGSGKSSILSALLGEMRHVKGRVVIRSAGPGAVGLLACCTQRPWIQNATLKENVLFGSPLDEARYEAALEACALRPDIAVLPAGDATEIGERGVNLSGGQQARVALARAVYSACPIVILDDVLSAVDAHVARHIFDHAIRGVLGACVHVCIFVCKHVCVGLCWFACAVCACVHSPRYCVYAGACAWVRVNVMITLSARVHSWPNNYHGDAPVAVRGGERLGGGYGGRRRCPGRNV